MKLDFSEIKFYHQCPIQGEQAFAYVSLGTMLGVKEEEGVRNSELSQVLPFLYSHGCVAASMPRLTHLSVTESLSQSEKTHT